MRIKRYSKILLSCLVLFGLLNPIITQAEETIDFIIHKRLYVDADNYPEDAINSGLIKEVEPGTYGMDGVEFTVYDLSEYFIDSKESYEDFAIRINNTKLDLLLEFANEKGTKIDTITTSTINGEAGVAKFSLNSEDYSSDMQMVLILETFTPEFSDEYKIHQKSSPMLISLPIENPEQEGDYLNVIHLYPKGYGYMDIEQPLPPITDPELPSTGVESNFPMYAYGLVVLGLMLFTSSNIKLKKKGK